ncbi:peptide-methionine (S)-S-oxide reductase [Algoriphagus locisalis]|uniref:Peptide methionine sulfoxide reductase MsrA n=1 Tax=Algoriphagus locisalis TaxID=305507 RepID=A0A1I6YHH7_9BACT|nr:peptide-methionine (S)-S-oxide reductase MsrA [Algoriphagus locisalis]SFT49781.1 peptide-methionine (S)-S-oxide reductase [Algoriphagus locisalis]
MEKEIQLPKTELNIPEGLELITLGAGCFWCVEAVFQRLIGVVKVVSGFAGGMVKNPTYEAVCTGTTGHAEVIQVYFDPAIISLAELFEIFWAIHNPTTLNKQGSDLGPQYRSVVFYHSAIQGDIAKDLRSQLDDSKLFDRPIVTEITEFSNFYPAENFHQDYYNQNQAQPYCQFVIQPKVNKLKGFFAERLK